MDNPPTSGPATFDSAVAARFGILPNFFRSAPTAPGLVEGLWGFAKLAYLDAPFPSLLKERLFVHLSRFCEVRYCIARHVGFLIGDGHAAGDSDVAPQSIEEVLKLLRRPVPDAAMLAAALSRMEAHDEPVGLPAIDSQEEADLFDALAVLFVSPVHAARARGAVLRTVGERDTELFLAFLGFVRMAHYWTETHPAISYEPDIEDLMLRHPALAELLLKPPSSEGAHARQALGVALADLESTRQNLHLAEQALSASEENFQRFAEACSSVIWMRDAETLQFTYVSPAFTEIYGASLEDVDAGNDLRNWARLIVPEDRSHALDCMRRVRAGERQRFEFRIRRPDGEIRWLRETDFPMSNTAGRVRQIGGIGDDITAVKQAEERQHLLLAELQHRTRNLVSVVQSLSNKSIAQSSTLEEFRDVFHRRLAAVSRVQGLLSRIGNSQHVTFDELLHAELAAHGVEDARVTLDGPEGVMLRSRAVQVFALALHELATNSVKYGALGDGGGRLAVRWSVGAAAGVVERTLHVDWRESGVDMSNGEVAGLGGGYGRELIERALPYQLRAATTYALCPDGVHCTMTAPIATMGRPRPDG